jgi:hypothetical protein
VALGATGRPALAHGVAGPRVFVTTLTIDDPAVADELSLPTVTWQRSGADGGPGPVYQTNISYEFAKRITENFGVAFGHGITLQDTLHDKQRWGLNNIEVTLKYKAYVSAEHEFMVSLGVSREFGTTGSAKIGEDSVSSTTPTLYFGKGLGDLPIGYLRPLAVTGQLGYTISDRAPKTNDNGDFNNGFNNRWNGGLSLQYSMGYLQSQVKDLGLPEWVNRLTPLVEVAWSSPTRPGDTPMQLVYAPGVAYSGDSWQLTVEALIPGNKNSGTNVGFIFQFHLFFDDLFPKSLGKPVVDWFR